LTEKAAAGNLGSGGAATKKAGTTSISVNMELIKGNAATAKACEREAVAREREAAAPGSEAPTQGSEAVPRIHRLKGKQVTQAEETKSATPNGKQKTIKRYS
jgi:hypothetical protein